MPPAQIDARYDRYLDGGPEALADRPSSPSRVWNRIPTEVHDQIIEMALEQTDLSPRELAVRFTNEKRYFVSEASVYRLLKAHDLITSPAYVVIKAADRFHTQTTRPNEMWQTDFTYFKIIGWGWVYLSTVLDDFSRYIIAWKLCTTMRAEDVTDTLDLALTASGCDSARVQHKPRLLSDLLSWGALSYRRTIAVNISASLLHNSDFQHNLSMLVQNAGVDPAMLVFEITESAAFDNQDLAVAAMTAMRALGVGLSIDDYGTGQSTLTYLKRLPANEIKIDKSFIQDVTRSRNDQILVRSTIGLAHEMGFKVVAEGIEDAETFALLQSYGCDIAQGYYVGRPMPIAELNALFDTPDCLAA